METELRPNGKKTRLNTEIKNKARPKPDIDDERFRHLDEGQKKIIALLIERNAHIDEICRSASLTASEAGAALTLMELEGLVAALAGKIYTLNV